MVTLRPRAARIALAPARPDEITKSEPAPRRRSRNGAGRAPLVVLLPAVLVALVMLAPAVYLLIRASNAGWDAIELMTRARTLLVLRNTVLLAAGVAVASSVVAVPLAWLTARTDLPGRAVWSSLAALPLVVPSYVGALTLIAAVGPRGLLQEGLEGLFGVERLPSDLRVLGGVAGADALHLPLRLT